VGKEDTVGLSVDELVVSFLLERCHQDIEFFRKGGEKRMRILTILLTIAIAMMFVGSALAVGPGKTLEYPDGAMGKVTFDGKIHADKGLKCNDCHTKIFQMKKGAAKMTMADINGGKFCGECHNGTKAFATKEAANCGKCHKK
jgi:c(7)-type cytochrome triheme protein